MFFVLFVIVGSRLVGEELPLFLQCLANYACISFGSATGFDFSFGNYRSITKIGLLYFVFERRSSLCFYFSLHWEPFGRAR